MATKVCPGVTSSMGAVEAILDCLRKLDAKPGDPINIYAVGPVLVDAGFDPDAIIDGLYSLESQTVIELLAGNRIALLKDISTSA